MRKIGDIHTFEDQAFLRWAVRASAAVLFGGAAAVVLWCAGFTALGRLAGVPVVPLELARPLGGLGAWLLGVDDAHGGIDPVWWLSLAAAIAVSLVAHELVHAVFFRAYAPPGAHVRFGANWRLGMIYASAEGIVYTRRHYLVIALAPSVAVTLAVLAVGTGLKWPLWTILVATVHLSGCTGDWGYVRALRRDPSIAWCEDTAWGVAFYAADIESGSVAAAPGSAPGPEGVVEGGLDAAGGSAGAATGADGGADGNGAAGSAGVEPADAVAFSVVEGGRGSRP